MGFLHGLHEIRSLRVYMYICILIYSHTLVLCCGECQEFL